MTTDDALPLFVYGTLMPGGCFYPQIAPYVQQHRDGQVPGVLVDLGAYPALLEEPGWVRGVLLAVAPAAIPVVDRIEGYEPDGADNLFERFETTVALDTGATARAWTYRFAAPSRVARRRRLIVRYDNGLPVHAWRATQS